MTAETKLRILAGADVTLQSFFGTNPFRWFYIQRPPGYIFQPVGTTCAQVQVLGAEFKYAQEAKLDISLVRFQVMVLDPNADRVDQAAAAIVDFLAGVDLSTDALFTSPPTTPKQFPTFIMNIRPGLEVATKPPIPTKVIDFKAWNKGVI